MSNRFDNVLNQLRNQLERYWQSHDSRIELKPMLHFFPGPVILLADFRPETKPKIIDFARQTSRIHDSYAVAFIGEAWAKALPSLEKSEILLVQIDARDQRASLVWPIERHPDGTRTLGTSEVIRPTGGLLTELLAPELREH